LGRNVFTSAYTRAIDISLLTLKTPETQLQFDNKLGGKDHLEGEKEGRANIAIDSATVRRDKRLKACIIHQWRAMRELGLEDNAMMA
jgi:hypothetical protein